MAERPKRVIKIFYCYANEDHMLRDELEKHLSPLKRLGRITEWYDRAIKAGAEWDREIATWLDTADIILLLVSSDFIHSDQSYSIEMQRALERHERREAHVISVLLRPVDWDETPLSKLQILPSNRKPVTRWADRDDAFLDIAKGIRQIVASLSVIPVETTWTWESTLGILPEREQRLAYLLYQCDLRPREIIRLLPEEFRDVQEITRLKRTMLERLLRSRNTPQ